MAIIDELTNKTVQLTPKKKFPLRLKIERKWKGLKFRVIFTENGGQDFKTDWLWNLSVFEQRNRGFIEKKVEKAESYINQELNRSIQQSLMESRRRQVAEAKIDRLFQ